MLISHQASFRIGKYTNLMILKLLWLHIRLVEKHGILNIEKYDKRLPKCKESDKNVIPTFKLHLNSIQTKFKNKFSDEEVHLIGIKWPWNCL